MALSNIEIGALVAVIGVAFGAGGWAWSVGDRITDLEARAPGQDGAAPEGAVVAFDLARGCPDGWTEFTDAAGRTIIGQGSGMDDENGKPLTGRKYRGHGGEEEVTLTIDTMPKHNHDLHFNSNYLRGGTTHSAIYPIDAASPPSGVPTAPAGEGRPHNNMPPYIALYFCKKN